MHWYLVHTKPRQECCALENLQRQGFECYLPTLAVEKLRLGATRVVQEPLFPRYLFIRLGSGGASPSWAPIRSTKGVHRLVSFGSEPAKVPDDLVERLLRQQAAPQSPVRLFNPGDKVTFKEGPFAGVEGVFHIAEGDRRAMVLIEMLANPVWLTATADQIRKIS